ncbi:MULTISPECIES: hypothetical protein [unclassified Streptomyces]|uniref:hypothetical protein n=1 Tax=unclassified Streptomyces TaxID=2593676 RepID=UPI0004BDE8F3|nr:MULTISPECIES: hypothetical protein [unclassified Streptomyces]
MNRKLIPAAAVATCAAAVLALFAGPVNADDAPGPVPSAPPTRAPSTSPTARPSVMPSATPVPGTPAPGTPVPGTPTPGIPTTGPTGRPGTGTGGGGGDATPTPRPGGGGTTPAPGCARPVPQLPTPEGVPGYGTVTLAMCATDHRTARGKLVFTAGYDTDGPVTYRVRLRWTYEGKPEAGCESCRSSARWAFTEDVYVNDAVQAEPLTVPFVLQHRGELIGEQLPGTGVSVVDIQLLEPDRQDNPAFVAPVPGATQPTGSP